MGVPGKSGYEPPFQYTVRGGTGWVTQLRVVCFPEFRRIKFFRFLNFYFDHAASILLVTTCGVDLARDNVRSK